MFYLDRPTNGIKLGASYDAMFSRWQFVADFYTGADLVKRGPNARRYLKPSPLEAEELENGVPESRSRYAFRKSVATYENFFKPVVDDAAGLMQVNEPTVRFGVKDDEESPEEVRAIQWRGNRYSDGLKGLKHRLNFHQVLFGRYGLLLDVATDSSGGTPRFVIVEYSPEKILDGEIVQTRPDAQPELKWALLNESGNVFDRKTKSWKPEARLRVLGIDAAGKYYTATLSGDNVRADWDAFDVDFPAGENVVYPTFKERTLDFVPFTVCNVDRLGLDDWQEPPYLDVAELALSSYVCDSWYKYAIYCHATPTLAICNATRKKEDIRLGGVIWLEKNGPNGPGADAKILETSGAGLAEMLKAKNSAQEALKHTSVRQLLDGAGANSSGEAIKLRTAAGTAAPAAIDSAGSLAIEEQLMFAARWAGATAQEAADRISFQSNSRYLDSGVQLQSVVSLLSANAQTKTLSNENMYAIIKNSFPRIVSDYNDNEAQKALDAEETFAAAPVNPLTNLFRRNEEDDDADGKGDAKIEDEERDDSDE